MYCYNPHFSYRPGGGARGRAAGNELSPNVTQQISLNKNFDSVVLGIVKNFQQRSLPDSISILINFGTEKDHILYDADNTNHECGMAQIWDPFSRVCRDIFCSTDQVLEQFTCSGGNTSTTTSGGKTAEIWRN